MNIRKKQKFWCVPVLPSPVHVSISVQSRAKFQVIFPPQPPSLFAFKVLMFSLLDCLDLWPGWGAQRCSSIRSPNGVASLAFVQRCQSESEDVSRCVFR